MAKTKLQKQVILRDLEAKLAKSKAVVFARFNGFGVVQNEELRNKLRSEDSEYYVAKKTLLTKALNGGGETIVYCQHPPILTVGSSGSTTDISEGITIPVIQTGRGGKVTYHGPGQQIIYPIVDLERWNRDIRAYIRWLQNWVIQQLQPHGLQAFAGEGDEIGVWVPSKLGGDRKIAAIGVRVRKGIAYHGVSINLSNDIEIYKKFVPCGLTTKSVTSLHAEAGAIKL